MKEFNFSKVVGLQPATLLKIELVHRYFSRVFSTVVEQLFIEHFPVAASVSDIIAIWIKQMFDNNNL